MKSISPCVLPLKTRSFEVCVLSEEFTGVNQIFIAGDRNTGKTCFAEALRRAFESLGATVTVKDTNERFRKRYVETLPTEKLPYFGKNIDIEVMDPK